MLPEDDKGSIVSTSHFAGDLRVGHSRGNRRNKAICEGLNECRCGLHGKKGLRQMVPRVVASRRDYAFGGRHGRRFKFPAAAEEQPQGRAVPSSTALVPVALLQNVVAGQLRAAGCHRPRRVRPLKASR
jgi:hypothetical protein